MRSGDTLDGPKSDGVPDDLEFSTEARTGGFREFGIFVGRAVGLNSDVYTT